MMVKRTTWQAREADLPVGSPPKFASSGPKIKPSGDTAVDQEHEVLRKDLVRVIDFLLHNPEHIQPAKVWLQCRIDRLAAERPESEQLKDASTLSKLMTYEKFVVSALLWHTQLTKAELEQVKSWGGDAIKHMFLYLFEAFPGLVLPHDMQSVANTEFDMRIASVGNRLKKVALKKGVLLDGTVVWSDIGPYRLETNNGIVVNIHHRFSGEEAIPPDNVKSTNDFAVESPFSSMRARAVCGLTKNNLHELFASDAGPHSKAHKPLDGKNEVFNQCITEAVRGIEALAHAAVVGQVKNEEELDDFGAERKRAKNEANAKRAKEALKQRATATNNKRKKTPSLEAGAARPARPGGRRHHWPIRRSLSIGASRART